MAKFPSKYTPHLLVSALTITTMALATGGRRPPACDADNGGFTLPAGFCAVVVGQALGPVRHLAVAANGDVFAALQTRGPGILALRDTNGDGRADLKRTFGPGGGSGIALTNHYLYFSLEDRIIRYPWAAGQLEPAGEPEVLVQGLPTGGHGAKGIAVLGDSVLYSSVGSRSNSCQRNDRADRSPGIDPCTELDTRAGVWRWTLGRAGQSLSDGRRVGTGLRNPMAIALSATGQLFAAVNGRDQLGENWGYSNEDNAEKPAEEFVRVEDGSDFGWPYCYYDPTIKKKVLAPEYGGDGRQVGRCSAKKDPEIGFPAHWAPMSVAFYNGAMFPAGYRGGAFLAFHGSWNREPLPQQGFRVVFAPFRGGKAVGTWTDFAVPTGNPIAIRPMGLAVGPDGSLYIGADQNGKIWRVMAR
jgi:glucose/arabinose dehydrogenase